MLQVHRITTDKQMLALRDDWNRLSGGVPFRGFAWGANWWKQYQRGGGELFILVARDASQSIVGIAPWFVEQQTTHGRVIAWLGSGEVCSDYQAILTEEAHADSVAEAFADWLATAASDRDNAWDLLHLDSVPAGDAVNSQFVGHMTSGGATVHREPGPNCWRIELPATWEAYVGSLSKSHRKQVRRIERRQLDSGRATIHTAESQIELTRGMEILVDLHQRRRASLNEPGCFASASFDLFLHEAARDLFAGGQLRLAWVEIEGVPAAVEFQVAGDDVTYAYQAGVHPDRLDDEPGRIINIATIRRAIDEGQQAFDFLRGDEPYKAHWRAQPQPTTTYRIVPPRTLAQVRHGLWLAGDNMKHWVKSGLELTGMKQRMTHE